jgi:hypothetical protein
MSERKTLDQQPGPAPEIRVQGDSVIFDLKVIGSQGGARLVIRCDGSGNVWMSIADPK